MTPLQPTTAKRLERGDFKISEVCPGEESCGMAWSGEVRIIIGG